MNEQTIILFFLIVSLGNTQPIYFKAKKTDELYGDERWEMIQLNHTELPSISTWLLIIVLLILPIFRQPIYNHHTTTNHFCLFWLGARNLL